MRTRRAWPWAMLFLWALPAPGQERVLTLDEALAVTAPLPEDLAGALAEMGIAGSVVYKG